MFLIVPVSAVDWHDDSRLKRIQLNINNSSIALTDYQMIKNITYDSDMQSDFDDLLFYNESGGNVSYWIESKTDLSTAVVWLNISSISTTEGAKVWMYYENSSVSSASDGYNTFIQYHGSATSSFVDSKVKGQPMIYEARVKTTSDSHDIRWGTAEGSPYSGDAFTIESVSSLNRRYIICYNEGNAIAAGKYETPSFTFNQYYKLKGVLSSTEIHAYVDDNEISNGYTSSALDDTMGIFMFLTSGTATQDWSFIRKYTATEPTWGVDGEEESYEAPPPALNGTFLYPNSTYSVGCYGKLISELVYETGFNFSDIGSCNALTTENMEVLSIDDTNYIPSIDKDAAHDGYMYGNFSLSNVESVNFINVKTVHNRNETNPVILGLFNVSTQKWHAVNNSSVEIVDVELTYNITGTDIAKYTSLIDNTLNLSVSLNTNGDGNYDVFVDFVEVYIDYEESPDLTLGYVYNLTISNQNNILILQNDVDDLKNNVNNLYLFVLLCTVFLVATLRKRGD